MNKHTPGPWEVDYKCTPGHIKSTAPREDSRTPTVARYDLRAPSIGEAEASANATLIAAAPDLLAACEAAMRIESLWYPANAGGPVDDPENHEAYALHLMREKFSAAIAKATNQKETTK